MRDRLRRWLGMLPDVFEWPRWREPIAVWNPPKDPRRFRVFFWWRIPKGRSGDGCFRWAVRAFGRELFWVHRGPMAEGYLTLVVVGNYNPKSEWHWPRPRYARRLIGGPWWRSW